MGTKGQQLAGTQVTRDRVGGTGGQLCHVLPTTRACTSQGSGALAGQTPLDPQGLRAGVPGSPVHED